MGQGLSEINWSGYSAESTNSCHWAVLHYLCLVTQVIPVTGGAVLHLWKTMLVYHSYSCQSQHTLKRKKLKSTWNGDEGLNPRIKTSTFFYSKLFTLVSKALLFLHSPSTSVIITCLGELFSADTWRSRGKGVLLETEYICKIKCSEGSTD